MNDAMTEVEADAGQEIRPFEWLTSSSSLEPFLRSVLPPDKENRVLHVGCGSSTLGEYLCEDPKSNVKQVVNVDKDGDVLRRMEKRWESRCVETGTDKDRMLFVRADFSSNVKMEYASGTFDLVVDKSTLDCLLCSDGAAAALLTEVHRLLHPSQGIYLLVTFHQDGFIRPLLEDCPGAVWDVKHSVMMRQVEDLLTKGKSTASNQVAVAREMTPPSSAWSSGLFEPDETYRRTVNVFICQRRGGEACEACELDESAVYQHVNKTNDEWYRSQNPMLTANRKEAIGKAFGLKPKGVEESYYVLFTEAEREHLTFEYFLEDWYAFLSSNPGLPRDLMSLDTALVFLDTMQ